METQGYSKEAEFQQQPLQVADYGTPPPPYPATAPGGQGYPAQPPPNYGQSLHASTNITNVMYQPGQNVTMTTITQSRPADYMGLAIFATICCCWPIGIFAIIKASQVGSSFNGGDYAGAKEASDSARKLSYISIGCGIASFVISILFVIIYVFVILSV
ncbi:proline-rich transmembrane protein 1-like [Saccoglossus kowalevskii]|uniref:Proline-rich transmembrane protein 1-like n=1 Tax=Saccoglossus kowalevskii TaxID=10224 RepID=A0ABM0GUE6_SACKO|nr:PREDICTED: proline-rich transmembrane protein 1-like [Saccoglossus kowalevskii]